MKKRKEYKRMNKIDRTTMSLRHILTIMSIIMGTASLARANTSAQRVHVEAPHIAEQPTDVMVARHQPATLNCRAGGAPAPTVRWYKGGVLVRPDPHRVLLPTGSLFFLRASHGRAHSDSGVYWCEAINAYGTARSRNATLVVAVLREDFRLEPASTQVAQGETVLLECAPPRGSPDPTVHWRKDGNVLSFDKDSRMHLVDGGSLVIQDSRQDDAGEYSCMARNAAGSRESAVANLSVHIKPYLITGPEDTITHIGDTVTFQCRVGGDPLPDVMWRRTAGGGNMPLGRARRLDDMSLKIESITVSDEGEYSCEADNVVGAVSASGFLTVYDPPNVHMKPLTLNVEVGLSASFECFAKGRPNPTVFWSIEGNRTLLFPGSSRDRYQTSVVTDGLTKLTLSVPNKADSGSTIVCSAVNFAGSAIAKGRLLVTSEDDRPPPIIVVGPANQTLPLKSMAVFHCNAIGSPIPVISWYREGVAIVNSIKNNISSTGTLVIRDLDREDNGLYTCVASSRNGKYVWSSNLLVDSPTNPSIHFFRAPDLSTLPGSPSKPKILNQTSEGSVVISWNQNNKIGSSSLVGYQIEAFGRELLTGRNTARNSHGWVTLAQRVPSTTYMAKFLTPGLTYVFMVRAENSHGLSGPSYISDPVTIAPETRQMWDTIGFVNKSEVRGNLQTENVVVLMEATPIDSVTIKVMWEVLDFYFLEGISIYYRALDNSLNSSMDFKMKTISHSNDVSGFEITDLQKYTRYEIFLVPFYKTFEGKPSNSKETRTLDDVPDGPPINIEMMILNATTAHLKWDAPTPHLQNGEIVNYNVIVNWLENVSNKSTIAVNTTVSSGTSLVMTNLSSAVTYTVQIAAATLVGLGPLSSPVALNLEALSATLDHQLDRISNYDDVTVMPGDFVMETWLLLLIGVIAVFKVVVIGTFFFFKKHHLFTKKGELQNNYDTHTNNGSLVTQMNIKAAVSLSHPLSSCYTNNSLKKTDSLLWSGTGAGAEYDRVAAAPEYAEVMARAPHDQYALHSSHPTHPRLPHDWNTTTANTTANTAYASVTLVANTRQCVSSLGWFSTNKNNLSIDTRYPEQEEIYPASNGGYYNRNVHANNANEQHFYKPPHSNVLKLYDFPGVDGKGQRAQLFYNEEADEEHMNISSRDRTSSVTNSGYGASTKASDGVEKTYDANRDGFYGALDQVPAQESDEENLTGHSFRFDGPSLNNERSLRPMKLLTSRHQYARPSGEYESTEEFNANRSITKFSSFKTHHPDDSQVTLS